MIGGSILLALFLIKFGNVWRVTPSNKNTAPTPSAIDLDTLLEFNDQHTIWSAPGGSDGVKFNAPLFDLFTPPNIYYEDKQLVMEPCVQWQFDTTFPLRLKTIKPKKYRLQFEGYVQPEQNSKYVIILHDVENNQTLHCEEGQSFSSLQFSILSFNIKTTEQDGMVINVPIVQIFDARDKQKFELTGDTKYYTDQFDVVLENIDGATYTLSEIGKEVKIGESVCILDGIDPKSKTANITLIDAKKQEFSKRLRML